MNVKLRGTLCGVGAAVFYGTNPLGAMNLYQDGISANSTLFYRFGLAIVMLGVMMLVQRKKFGVTRSELLLLAILGMFMGSSSASLFISFNYMDVGIASTLLFVYPVMVAVIMALLFCIILRCFLAGTKATSPFGAVLCAGVGAMFFIHTAENIGMCIGLTPVTGIPLPFFSYGGTALVTSIMGIGIVMSRSRNSTAPLRKERQ